MYPREEEKAIRTLFWTRFGQMSGPRRRAMGKSAKWMLHKTGISSLKLKFDFPHKNLMVCLDVQGKTREIHHQLTGKILSLKPILDEMMYQELIWEQEYFPEAGAPIFRLYVPKTGISITDKKKWGQLFDFMFVRMNRLEEAYLEVKDYLKSD